MEDRETGKEDLIQELSELRSKNRELEAELRELRSKLATIEKEQRNEPENNKFEALAESSPFGLVVISQDGVFKYSNPRFRIMFGYDTREIPTVQEWCRKAFPDENYRKGVMADWFSDLKQSQLGALSSRIYSVTCKDGSGKVIHFRPVQLGTGQNLVTCEDITEFKKIDDQVRQTLSILESTLESTADGLLVVDRSRHLSSYNKKFLEIWGISEELASKKLDAALLAIAISMVDDPEAFLEKINYLYDHPEEESFDTIRFENGTVLERYSKPQRIDDEIVGRVWCFRDVTAQKELENDLAEAIEDLKRANLETNGLLESARSILENPDFRTAAQFILRGANKFIGATVGHITLLNPEGSEQTILSFESGGLPCNVDPNALIPITGFHALAYDNKKAFYKNDVLSGDTPLDLPNNHVHLENFLFTPLIVRKKAFGLLGLGNKPGGFDEDDGKLAEAFAEVLALGILNWRISEELERSEERYRMIFAHSPFGIMHYDQDGVIIDCNDRFVEILGSSRSRLQRFRMLEELRDPKLLEGLRLSLIGKTGHYEGDYHSVTGNRDIPLRAVFSSVRSEDGKFLGGVGIYEDMGRIRAAERVLLQAERVKAVADLAHGVAHNFNNLLQIIMGSLDVVLIHLENSDSAKAKKILERMRDSVTLGAQTVKRLQTFARVRATEALENQTLFDVSQTMAQAIEMTKPLWKDASEKDGISIRVRQNLEKGVMVKGQANEIFEVMASLVENAVEACVTGGEIDVSSYPENGYAVIEVKDTGIGIAEADLKRVFDPFWTSKKTHIGTGMGLAVSHSIVKSHGGSIAVVSAEGKGTTFTIKLPLVNDVTLDTEEPEQTTMSFSRNVLVIDDMEPIVEMLGDLLTELGHSVFAATSGSDAIQIYELNKVDIVICDLMMPGMDGWKVGQAIASMCADRGVAKTPFVLLTGWGGQQMEVELMRKSGVDALLEKPIDMTRLTEVITRLTTG